MDSNITEIFMEVAAKPVYSYLIAMLEAGGPIMLLTEAIYEHSCRLPEQADWEALSYIEFWWCLI